MQRSLFGVFTAFLCAICVLLALEAFRKKWLSSDFSAKCLYKSSEFDSRFLRNLILIRNWSIRCLQINTMI